MTADTTPQQPQSKPADGNGILSIVLIYAVFAAGWILLSDKLVQLVFSDPYRIILVSIVKGWLFVGITSLLLYSLMQRWGGGERATKIIPVGSRRLRVFFLSLAMIIVLLTCVNMIHAVKHERTEVIGRMQAVTEFKALLLADWLQQRQGDADFIQTGDFFTEQYRRWQESGNQDSGERLQQQLAHLQKSRNFDAVVLLDPGFKTLAANGSSPFILAQPLQAAAQLAAVERKVQRVGPSRDAANGRLSLDFIIPLTAIPGSPPLIVLHLDLMNRLSAILQSRPAPDSETLLFQRDGDRLVLLNALNPPSAKLDVSAATENLFTALIGRSQALPEHPEEIPDGRVVGVVCAIPGTDWLLVTKQDLSEFYAETVDAITWSGFVGLLALFMTGAGFYLFQQRQQLTLAQAIQQSQAERLRALHLLATIADSSDDPIFAKDREGRYTLFNRAASLFVGKSAEEVIGRDDRAIFPPEQAEMLIAFGQRVIAENRTMTQEEVLSSAQGERTFLTTKGPLRDNEGNVTGIFGISRDITERKTAEAQLRISEERLKLALDATSDGLWDWDLRSGLAYLTPHYYEMTGYRPDQVVPDFEFFKLTVHPDDLPLVLEAIEAHLQGKTPFSEFDYRMLTFSGETKWIRGRGRVVDRNADGTPVRIIGTITDIGAYKAVEEALRRQTQELAQRNAELERFNRATVGRELDMIVLKRQVNELSRQLGQEPVYPLAFLDVEPAQE